PSLRLGIRASPFLGGRCSMRRADAGGSRPWAPGPASTVECRKGFCMPGLTGHRRLLLVAILIGALVLAACGGSSDSEPTTASGNTGDPGSTPAPSDTAPGSSDLDGPIVFADFGWDSAYFHNRVAQFILEHGYGYETTSVPGETVPLTQGMIRGDVHVATEFWADQNPPFLEAVEEGTIL